ncbi:TfuA-like protein [Lentzea sp. NPDC059081]|uniref:TfuA-like protein n=1 Tax=Lentzea sp. NPDC059081 TaxID=3346719 RepID=UPI00369ECBA1
MSGAVGLAVTVHVFTGPTLTGAAARELVRRAVVHPPVAHGDLLRIPFLPGDVVVIVDGYYHQAAAVRHKEILALLDSGVSVVGCSSMGALRAAELDMYGMVGNGRVYEMFRDGVVDADDEVAVAHTPAPEYRKLSEPLVTIRHVVACAVRDGHVSSSDGEAVVAFARRLPYTARSWRALGAVMARDAPESGSVFARLETFRATRGTELDVKAADARDTLRRLDELVAGARASRDSGGEPENAYLREWRAAWSGAEVHGVLVSDRDVVRYQQIYLADFPRRWEEHALERIAESATTGDPAAPLRDRAIAVAAASGLTGEALTAEQRAEWMTTGERSAAGEHDQLLKVLRRSYRSPSPVHDLMTACPGLVDDAGARQAVAEAVLINRQVATWGVAHGIDHLKPQVLRGHLAGVWGVSPDREELLAAARDRGLISLDDAVRAVRPFYLRAHFGAVVGATTGEQVV